MLAQKEAGLWNSECTLPVIQELEEQQNIRDRGAGGPAYYTVHEGWHANKAANDWLYFFRLHAQSSVWKANVNSRSTLCTPQFYQQRLSYSATLP